MYRSHFGLKEKPFRIAPSPRFMYLSETHDEGRARILYGIRESRGFVVVTGRVGLGKTTVLLSVLDELETQIRTALIFNPVETFEQLLRMICYEFGIETDAQDQVDLMRALNEFLLSRLAAGESCVVLIDEAQNLSVPLLEKLRMLNNLQTEEASLLQVVLVGQPELIDRMEDPRLRQLRQRVGVWHEIEPLDREDTKEYIFHRLRQAGAPRPKDIIPAAVCERVHALSSGVPRLMNQICDTAMVIAYARSADWVEVEHIEEAALELRVVPQESPSRPQPVEEVPRLRVSPAPPREEPPAPGARPRWPILVGTILVTAILVGAVVGWASWGRWTAAEPSSSAEPTAVAVPTARALTQEPAQAATEATPSPESRAAATTPPAVSAETTASIPAEPAGEARGVDGRPATPADPLAQFSKRVEARVAAIQEGRGASMYTVHLGSFEDEEKARAFAAGLLGQQPDWAEPFFLETVEGDPTWYRVLAGGFAVSRDARGWVRTLRSSGQVDYAQLTRLPGTARALSWTEQAEGR